MSDPPPYRPLFASQPFGNDQSTSATQLSTNTPGNQSLFAPAGSKPIFGSSSAQSVVEPGVQKPSIFGGSAFSKPSESSFAAPSRQSIFGGPLQPSVSQSSNEPKPEENTNVSQSGVFGKPKPIFGGAFNKTSDKGLAGSNSIFGGTFSSQKPSTLPSSFANVTSPTTEPTSTTKSSIFGGGFMRKEEATSRTGIATPLRVQDSSPDNPRGIFTKSSSEDVSKEEQSLDSNKFPSFSSSKSVFGRFSASGIVTSSLSPSSHERSDNLVQENVLDKQSSNNIADQRTDRSLNNLADENQESSGITQSKESIRSNKIIRKRGVFGKAIEDMAGPSSRNQTAEENRSLVCYSEEGELPDVTILKDHFSQYGRAVVNVNRQKRYVSANFKTSADAQKAMNGDKIIDGVHFKFFWRNVPKARRRSSEEIEKKSPEVRKKPVRQMEMDPSVREELEAISGIEYNMPKDISSKRKVSMGPEARKKSRSLVSSDPEALLEKQDPTPRFDGSKDSGSRSIKHSRETRSDEKLPIRPRIERKSFKKPAITSERDEGTEIKFEKGELSTSEGTAVPTAAISELQEILKQQALSSDDKLKVLEARDKIMRLRQVKQYDISKAVRTVGTCPDMCPEKERILRETRRQISLYEMSSSKPNEMDPNLMVKQYSRSSADQEEPLPHELRPPAVLTMTMNYLMHSIMSLGDQPGENLGEWYHFLWDRLRGIRKEITQQELCDVDAVHLVEQCARFHIHCGGRLVAEDMSVFDDRINTENLTKCLQTLKHMYHDLWTNNSITCSNEPEFISYFLLLNLNTGIIMWEMEQLQEEVLKSPEIAFVAAMYNSLSSNNFVRFFRLVRKASYLNSCLCIRYFVQVREKALNTYVKALAKIRPVQYPLSALVEELGFENSERAAAFCTHYGLMVDHEATWVTLSPDTYENPTYRFPSERALRLAESKKMGSVGEVVNGGPLPARSFEGHCVHESFDENGYLRKDSFHAKDQGLSDFGLKEGDYDELLGETRKPEKLASSKEMAAVSSAVPRVDGLKKNLLQVPAVTFGKSEYENAFPSTFSNIQTSTLTPMNTRSNQIFKTAFTGPTQSLLEKQDTSKSNSAQSSSVFEPIKRLLPINPFTDQVQADAQAKAQAEAKYRAEIRARAELEESINKASEHEVQELLQSGIQEFTAEIALVEWNNAEEEDRAQEQLRVEEQFRAQEELRKRILDAHIERISSDSVSDLLEEVVGELVSALAHETHSDEEKLVEHVKHLSEESLTIVLNCVIEEMSHSVALEELKAAQEIARQAAVKNRVKEVFYFWLERARRSLRRRHVMEDFPASVIPLSVKEHAERWGFAEDIQANALEACSKGTEKTLDFLELKALRAYPQIAFAELIGVQVVHRYDTVRSKLDLRPTDKLLYKTFVSVPEDYKDPATQLIDWWIRRTFKQNCTMLCDDMKKGLFRLVSGVKVTSEVAVYASLQMVRGQNPLKKQPGLASGSSAVLFTVSPTSNLLEGKARLSLLLKSMRKLPALPLVVAVISPIEPPIDGLKQLAQELDLDQWLGLGVICDYQILHVKDLFDIKYLSERFNMAFNYMVMTWTPSPEFSLVCFKNVLKSTFQMFYISIQFNHNSSEIYPQDVDDPRVIVGLCNEWLDHMCCEFVESYYEARVLCGDEFWPLIYKGAYLPFLNNPSYVQILKKVILAVHLPTIEWPPSSEEDFDNLMAHYCSWLGPDEKKQTLRRLSCLNGLAWPDKLKSIPWVNLIEDWMEARINYLETCALFGTELLCLMRTPNVEHLYTYPWWAQSRYILDYLETRGSGGDCAMDVDQTVPDEGLANGHMSVDEIPEESTCTGLQHLEEVTNSVNELKSANESLFKRIQTALADGSETCTQGVVNTHFANNAPSVPADVKDGNSATSPDFKSIVDTIDRQVQAERDFRSNLNLLFSQALDEAKGVPKNPNQEGDKPTTFIHKTQSESTLAAAVSQPVHEEGTPKTSTRKMDEIMAAVNSIVSSLDQKYKILDSSSCFEKISDLKMGVGKVDNVATLLTLEDLQASPFVEQSQRRMQGRLQGSAMQGSESTSEKPVPHNAESDLEMLSDDSASTVLRTGSSASPSIASDDNESDSDPENSQQSYNSDKTGGNGSRKRPQHYDSDSDFQSGKRMQRNSDSEEEVQSGSEDEDRSEKISDHSDSDDDYEKGKLHKKVHSGSSENVKSARKGQYHHSDSEDHEESNSSTSDHHYNWHDSSKEKAEHHSSDQGRTRKAPHQHKEIQESLKNEVAESKSEDIQDVDSDSSFSEHAETSDCDDVHDEEEVQTISSEESRDSIANHVDHSSVSESASRQNDNYFITETNTSSANYVVCENELTPENGLISEGDEGGNLISLDNVQNHYQYYEEDVALCEGSTYYTMSSDVGILHSDDAPSEVVLSNSDPVSEGNHVYTSQLELGGENAVQYEVELEDEENEVDESGIVSCGETLNLVPDEDVDDRRASLSKGYNRHSQLEDSDSAEEECEVGEEEEDFGEEGDEELEETMEEEGEEEAESAVESEGDEDSDVCEVIDDD